MLNMTNNVCTYNSEMVTIYILYMYAVCGMNYNEYNELYP